MRSVMAIDMAKVIRNRHRKKTGHSIVKDNSNNWSRAMMILNKINTIMKIGHCNREKSKMLLSI